jgi:hypothetical protein
MTEKTKKIVAFCKARIAKAKKSLYVNFWFVAAFDLLDNKYPKKRGVK